MTINHSRLTINDPADGWNVVAELQWWATSGTLKKSYIWGVDMSGSLQGAGGVSGLLSMRLHDLAKTLFFCYDGNGNVVRLIDISSYSKETVAQYTYDPFGRLIASSGTYKDYNDYLFSTKRYERQWGLNYYGYRFYSVDLGRWITRDPIGEQGGLNLYGFVGNRPVEYIDYMGKDVITPYNPPSNEPEGPVFWEQFIFGPSEGAFIDNTKWFEQRYRGWVIFIKKDFVQKIKNKINEKVTCNSDVKDLTYNLEQAVKPTFFNPDNNEDWHGDKPQDKFWADKVLGSFVFRLEDSLVKITYNNNKCECNWSTAIVISDGLGLNKENKDYQNWKWLFPPRSVTRAKWPIEGEFK